MKDNGALYFTSTKSSVEIISSLQKECNWRQLARFYDLTESSIKYDDLISGSYFMQSDLDRPRHPGFSRITLPFAPGFRYDGEYNLRKNIIVVRVKVTIEQGHSVQTGFDSFSLKKSSKGYSIIPLKYSPFPLMPPTA